MLIGDSNLTIDEKGRLTIPAKFRDDLGEHFVITRGMDSCLYVFPEEEWKAFEEQLAALPITTDSETRRYVRFFTNLATPGDLDKQGRTLLPARLREYAGLGKDVVFIGMGKRAEIWDKEKWEAENAEVEENIEGIASAMDANGFRI